MDTGEVAGMVADGVEPFPAGAVGQWVDDQIPNGLLTAILGGNPPVPEGEQIRVSLGIQFHAVEPPALVI